jgi:protein-tyrosine phosphatase
MKVLFVCSGNVYRSPVAEALLKKFRPDIQADSAGTNPVLPTISESARKFLKTENALNYLKGEPEGLDEKKLDEYDLIVAMKPHHKEIVLDKCPSCEGKIVVWNIDDPYFLPERETKIFQQIKNTIKDLANTI